jgi:hypothetical protein
MDWFVTTGVGAKPIGPFPEEQVVEMIRGGMRIVGAHAKEGGAWIAPETHAPFAAAMGISGTPAVMTSPPVPTQPGIKRRVLFGSLGSVLVVLFVWTAASDGTKKPTGAAFEPDKVIAPALASRPAPPPERTPAEKILTLESAPAAVAFARPHMSDTANEASTGTALLALWAMNRLRWSDVAVAKDETSFALVQKDSDEERGKRLCTSGNIAQIAKEAVGDDKVYNGLLVSGGGNIYKFTAVGSSGALVERSWARFCGFVTGRYDYSNSGGGTGHAVSVVGMFDLPENKTVAQPVTAQQAAARKALPIPVKQSADESEGDEQPSPLDYAACRKRCTESQMAPDQMGWCLKTLCGE